MVRIKNAFPKRVAPSTTTESREISEQAQAIATSQYGVRVSVQAKSILCQASSAFIDGILDDAAIAATLSHRPDGEITPKDIRLAMRLRGIRAIDQR